ncbi:hypothetical protein [uncultured Maribacter sp.]|uniref:hypothetical protein n=1 Tax=uncultured Maribacter sp. TaxID=431308 RepID=UPI0026103405|nr:hypothetical protein [uncultured Maribacter sp.]
MQKYLRFLVLLITLIVFKGFSQENTKLLHGKAISSKNDVSNILIVNLNSKKSTITDSLRLFSLEVAWRDSVRFTAVQYQTKELVITDAILKKDLVIINFADNVINLKEVTVMPYNLTGKINLDIKALQVESVVTSSKLHLPNANIEKMPQSERLLIEADRGKYMRFYVIALTINTHKVLNKLSGRTKSFEEMVARDLDMQLEGEIIDKFSKKTMSEDFDIPETNIDGFLTYCMSQKDFSELAKAKNAMEIWEYLIVKSIEFKKAVSLNN